MTDESFISSDILDEVNNKVEKNRWEEDNVTFKKLIWYETEAAKNQDIDSQARLTTIQDKEDDSRLVTLTNWSHASDQLCMV